MATKRVKATLDDALCTKCFGVGNIEIKPDQLAMLRRPDLELPEHKHRRVRIYEHGDGSLEVRQYPYTMRVVCPTCSPMKKRPRGIRF